MYWLGYWSQNTSAQGYYDTVAGGGRYAPAGYSATAQPARQLPDRHRDSIAYSLYATLASGAAGAPVNTSPPTIAWDCEPLGHVTADPGSWTNSPTGFSYQWQTCDDNGQNCVDYARSRLTERPRPSSVWEAATPSGWS